MEKYKYNQLEEYSGINIEEYFESKILKDISIIYELEFPIIYYWWNFRITF